MGGIIVALMGIACAVYYLSFGVFYDGETFLVSSFGKKDKVCCYGQIRHQQLYVVQGGSAIVELHMEDGSAVSVQTTMEGAGPFLNYAFARWCEEKKLDPDACAFHNPGELRWFPEEEV